MPIAAGRTPWAAEAVVNIIPREAARTRWRAPPFALLGLTTTGHPGTGVRNMSKSQDTKKEPKKKPSKSIKEKRAEKKSKRASKG